MIHRTAVQPAGENDGVRRFRLAFFLSLCYYNIYKELRGDFPRHGREKMKKFFSEFKTFALRGNMIDLAVGVIIGGAFQGIVKSLVDDVINPLLGLLFQADLSNLSVTINSVELKYGSFISAVINFLIMAFVIFCFIKALNTIAEKTKKKKEEEPPAPTTKKCPFCMSEISIEATRCPHCTSVLPEEKAEDAE